MVTRAVDRRVRTASGLKIHPPEHGPESGAVPVGARLIEENEGLRTRLIEVEGWYRLLQSDHEALRKIHLRTTTEATKLQAECHRLAAANDQLQTVHDHGKPSEPVGTDTTRPYPTVRHQEPHRMKLFHAFKRVLTNRWALPAVALVALAAREPSVRGLAVSAVRSFNPGSANDPAAGYLGYARLVNARDAYERARDAYNAGAESLKGDALLESQDKLRAARLRYQKARAEFLPALRAACVRADIPFPSEAAAMLVGLKGDETARE